MGYFLSLRFLVWFVVGAGVAWWLLDRKGRDPLFGAVVCGLIGGVGGIVPLAFIFVYLYYFLPGVPVQVTRPYNPRPWWRFWDRWL